LHESSVALRSAWFGTIWDFSNHQKATNFFGAIVS